MGDNSMRHTVTAALAALILLSPAAADSPYLYGIHDDGGEYLMSNAGVTGYITITEALGHNPSQMGGRDYTFASSAGHTVIARLNNGYNPNGTIPLPQYYSDFATRVGNFVEGSTGCHMWIIGNEPNLSVEWPSGQPIYPSDYIDCFLQCEAQIKSRTGHAGDVVIPAAIGTYAAGSPPVCVGDWIDYFQQVLVGTYGHCDAITLHTYTHGTDPNLIFSNVTMNAPYNDRYYHFRAYRNYMDHIPTYMRDLPVYITETDQMPPPGQEPGWQGWANVNSGWVRNAYYEIDTNWNAVPGNQTIRCVCLYRWHNADVWCWQYKQGVKDDFTQACGFGYRWDDGGVPDDASMVGHGVPDVMFCDETVPVHVTVRNTGTASWAGSGEANLWRLGAGSTGVGCEGDNEFPWSNFAAGGYSSNPTDQRVYCSATVDPDTLHTFTFDVTAPSNPGDAHFSARMVHDGVAWFGDGLDLTVSVIDPSVNVLDNPSFETSDLTSWTTMGVAMSAQSGPWQGGIVAYDGVYFAGLSRTYSAAGRGGLYQRVPAQSGDELLLTAWANMYWLVGDGSGTRSRVGLDPYGGTNQYAAWVVWSGWETQPQEGTEGWRQLSVSATAAAGTVTAFLEFDQVYQGGSELHVNCFDDVALYGPAPPVPESTSPPGWLRAGWNLVSVPLEPVDPAVAAVWDVCIAAGNVLLGNLYGYSPGSGYSMYDGTLTEMALASGYWLNLTTTADEDLTGYEPADPAQLPLADGWNLIGHPWTAAAVWADCLISDGAQQKSVADAEAAGWIQGTIYYYDGAYRTLKVDGTGDDTMLRPWHAYWLLAGQPGLSLLVDKP